MALHSKRPSLSTESMCVYNRVDAEERWISTIIKIGSWITMKSSKRRKINEQLSHFITTWKGKVKKLKIEKRKKMVLIQLVFMHKEIFIQPNLNLPQHRPNCKYYCTSSLKLLGLFLKLKIIEFDIVYYLSLMCILPTLKNGKILRA